MPRGSFNGLRVLSLESRRATEIATLIGTFGGQALVAPALREVPLSSNTEAVLFGKTVVQGGFDAVIFLTGVGARVLLQAIESDQPRDAFLSALRRMKVAARGPKPVAVLREWQVPVWLTAPEPNTWRELLSTVANHWTELPAPPRIAVQEYGVPNPELLQALEARGAAITSVPVYQWRLPEDLQPLQAAVQAIARGEIHVALFTTGVQVAHLFEVAKGMNLEGDVAAGLSRAVIASIGPTTSAELARRGISVDLEASHPKMGVLVTEASDRAAELLAAKSSGQPRKGPVL
jgi:uroporphyrinogen-III synthase